MTVSESILHESVADYLRLQYPHVLFHSDFGSGIKLTMGQAVKQKRLNGGRRAWPDLFIAERRTNKTFNPQMPNDHYYGGLFIELKKEGTRLRKKDGNFASEHIAEQFELGLELIKRGYKFEFVVGFEEAKKVIDAYLGGNNE